MLAELIASAIQIGGSKPDFNQGAAEVQVGPVRGVVARHVTGNERGTRFAAALVEALVKEGIEAVALPGMMENLIKPEDRNSEGNSWVIVVVGEKPS